MVVRATTSTTATAPFNILDVYTGAAAAYSLRRLRGAYSGAAVRVRRSNDNAEQDIGFDANGNFNESALTSFVGANSAFVTTWYDQSGNARNATQTTAANQPRIVNAGVVDRVNGRVAPTYPAASMGLVVSPFASSVLHSFGVSQLLLIGGASAAYLQDGTNSTTRPYWFRSNIEIAGSNVSLSPAIDIALRSRLYPQGPAYRNGVLFNSGAQTVGAGVDGLTIGNRFTLTESAGGGIPEFIAYFTDQSANRAAIESNIMSYFGIN